MQGMMCWIVNANKVTQDYNDGVITIKFMIRFMMIATLHHMVSMACITAYSLLQIIVIYVISNAMFGFSFRKWISQLLYRS